MKKLLITIFLIGGAICVQAQKGTDVNSIFKMLLFLNKPNVNSYSEDPVDVVKNDSLFQAFKDIIEIQPEKMFLNCTLSQYVLINDYNFYKIDLDTSSKYARKLTHAEGQILGLFYGVHATYVIAIDDKRGKCYRIAGFDQNDFLSFLIDFKEHYEEETLLNLSTNKFLINFTVEGIDFKCLYEGLKEDRRDIIKYPCLKRVNDPVGYR